MKFIGKLILYVLIALLVVILGLYFLLQTRWGAEHISALISEHSDYQLSFEAMDHRFSSPSHILLKNVTFGRDGQPATLVAKAVDIGLSTRQLTHPRHVDTILLQNGTLNISPQTAPLPFQSDRLQLQDMALNSPGSEWDLSAQRVNGGIIPWLPEAGKVLGSKAQIQLSAGSLTLNDVPAANVLIEGSIDNEQVTLSTIGADIARGALTGVAKRHADGSWMVENLRLNDIRLQSDKSLADFFAPLNAIPSLQINRLEVTDARLQGPDWAVTDLDLSLRNLTFSKDDWQTQEGKLSMNASEFIFGSLHLFDPILNAEFSPQGIALRQFTTRWEGGMVRTSGNWLREGKALILDDAAIVGIEYTLPENWKQRWMQPLPTWLNSLTLKKFTASRNLVIDIDPTFPWQLTALDGYGANLGLVQNQKWGVWSGNATLNAAAATFNRVDVRRPSLSLAANANTVNISELSAFTERGILEATASVSQLPPRQTQISLNGRGVPVNVLQQWGWPALPIAGDGNIQLTASGTVQADAPLKPTVNGQLHAVNANKQQVTQTMQAGVVSAGEVTSTEPAPVSPAPVTP
ncbi:TPA: AsmA family protein [Citrobacter amalonaticus]|uniref:AsmA family protein n=1 Tax=Citrobacter amalonaticus TaxID=35703 RepID=UPI001904247E|nr:AsmA family protein [Citrobacter amalonaticus]MBJ8737747.1 AsmA family protein [Citrobacter amalonaticus]MBY5254272.1 AsmA family protein [Citrobacter amalonaticus]HCD1275968.1 AsmA family protein [Citrobacter amalonaticus]HEM8613410.1 AsmA family protein [Citrobacter amalonaticus]